MYKNYSLFITFMTCCLTYSVEDRDKLGKRAPLADITNAQLILSDTESETTIESDEYVEHDRQKILKVLRSPRDTLEIIFSGLDFVSQVNYVNDVLIHARNEVSENIQSNYKDFFGLLTLEAFWKGKNVSGEEWIPIIENLERGIAEYLHVDDSLYSFGLSEVSFYDVEDLASVVRFLYKHKRIDKFSLSLLNTCIEESFVLTILKYLPPTIRKIHMDCAYLNLECCRELKKFSDIQILSIPDADLADESITWADVISSVSSTLEVLDVSFSSFDSEAARKLVNFPNLKTLIVEECDTLSIYGLSGILPRLERLNLNTFTIIDYNLPAVAWCKTLKHLSIVNSTEITPCMWMKIIEVLPKTLETIDVSGTFIDKNGLDKLLQAFPNLKTIHAEECRLRDTNYLGI